MDNARGQSEIAPPAGEDGSRPPTPLERSLARAGLAVRRCWSVADALPIGLRVLMAPLVVLLPFVVLVALSADLLAFLFGSVGRAVVSWTVLFIGVGLVVGLLIGGEAVTVLPVVMGVTGLLVGLVLGILCGRIFRGLPDYFDRHLSGR